MTYFEALQRPADLVAVLPHWPIACICIHDFPSAHINQNHCSHFAIFIPKEMQLFCRNYQFLATLLSILSLKRFFDFIYCISDTSNWNHMLWLSDFFHFICTIWARFKSNFRNTTMFRQNYKSSVQYMVGLTWDTKVNDNCTTQIRVCHSATCTMNIYTTWHAYKHL